MFYVIWYLLINFINILCTSFADHRLNCNLKTLKLHKLLIYLESFTGGNFFQDQLFLTDSKNSCCCTLYFLTNWPQSGYQISWHPPLRTIWWKGIIDSHQISYNLSEKAYDWKTVIVKTFYSKLIIYGFTQK